MNLKHVAYAEYLPEKRKRRRANTVDGYLSALRCHVVPKFGHREIEEITHEEIQEWVDGFEKPGAARKAFKTLRQVMRWTIRKYQLRIWDPTQGVELPQSRIYRPKTLTANEVKTTLRGFWGHELEPTIILSSCLGLRPGEAYALRWDRIDMRTGAVRICKTLQQVGSLTYTYAPKTSKSDRVLYLPKFALDRMKTIWRDRGKPKSRIIGDATPQRISRTIKHHCRKEGLPFVPMYNRRHSWATISIEGGATIEAVAMMLGHTSIMTAYEHYIVQRDSVCKSVQSLFQSAIMSS